MKQKGIRIASRILSIGQKKDIELDTANIPESLFKTLAEKEFPTLGDSAALEEEIAKAELEKDSVGGVAECFVTGLPAGIGDPMFDSLESRLAAFLFSIPAVKGVEFGDGFHLSEMRASEANDAFCLDENKNVRTETNRNGGILGGISTGMPLVFRAAFKPTPSIGICQKTVCLNEQAETTLTVGGRHDPCIVRRALPVLESAAALVLADFILGK